ncbi:DUF885 domain-containing protein, partial [Massilia cavernae]
MEKLSAALLGAYLLLAASAPSHAATADERFKEIYTQEWKWRLTQRLEDGEDDDNPIRAELPKIDPVTQLARLQYWSGVLQRLAGIAPARLSAEERINYAVYRAQIQALASSQQFREYEKPLNADSSFWSSTASVARKPLGSAADYRKFIAQLNDVPRYFREQVANMRSGLQRGFTPPKVTLTGRDISLSSVTEAASPQDTVFYLPFKSMPSTISADEQRALREAGLQAIREAVIPAHAELLKFMRNEYVPRASEALAAESLPDGKAYYQSKIVEFTTTNMDADRIHQIGLSEMAKIRAEMQVAIRQTGFSGDFPAFLQFLRSDPRFYAKTAEELLMRAAFIAKKFDAKAGQYFGYLPRRRFAITPVPDDIAPYYTSGRGWPGVYLVNTYNLPSRALYSLPALTLHESAPGHAFQMPVALEQKGRPAFRRAYISAYGEGWAL